MKYIIFFSSLFLFVACWETTSSTTSPTDTSTKTSPTTSTTPKNTTNKSTSRSIDTKWLCIPGKQVGMISTTTTEVDIQNAYGKENVLRKTIGMGEGETAAGTVVFPDTDNEVIIEWARGKSYEQVASVRIGKNNTAWKTDQNISIGTTLKELQIINGKAFKFAGFEWDYAGIANSWEGGKIDPHLTVFLEAANPKAIYPNLMGDELFLSSHPKAIEADLRVRSMTIALD